MCNLYRMTKPADEVARMFGVEALPANAGAEVFPGYPGMVLAQGALRPMTWGFPFATRGKSGQMLKPRPVNNARSDKLSGGFWRPSFISRRCLIPLSAFAEAEGPKGGKTRTWFSLPGQEIFTAAGIWRDSAEWGPVYSMVMTDACVHLAGVHDRMPVLIDPAEREQWSEGTPEEAFVLCRPYAGDMLVERTEQPWNARR
ncbi:SOS response-associated peptidase [Croceicoccus mobilis]|uniref:Abasic site processing protein n=1 Tax=Croceicoccus mobilis TaxID=1703339 RepID=A0A916Z0L7_9SPHN|nr:SOS response-associated peptidase family protein [Croceicoccus mobilis]GGD70192.1 DUF159 family protein [Croceicoccus mobilis]